MQVTARSSGNPSEFLRLLEVKPCGNGTMGRQKMTCNTAYLVSAVKRRRKDYLIQLYKRSSIESTVEVVYESEPSSEEVVLDKLPLMDVIENGALLEALQKLNERERQIFLARTLEEEDFETLGAKFGLSYKGAAALYYRTIQKIRKSIEGGDKR